MKKYITFLLVLLMVFISMTGVYAGFKDVSDTDPYIDAILRMAEFGIMSGDLQGNFLPDKAMTREEFAKLIISVSKLDSAANTLMGISIYKDVEPGRWSCGYINAAVNKEYIMGKPDGKFHPEEAVTFAEVCTGLVRALGYKDTDLSGVWPGNYIDKAKELGITEGINLGANDSVLRKTIAVMIDRLLVTNINSTTVKQTFAASVDLFTECIVLADSTSLDTLAPNQIATDKGIYYLKDADISLEIGNQYGFKIEDDTIVKVFNKLKSVDKIQVVKYMDKTVTYKTESGDRKIVLPEKTVYYYKGNKTPYTNLDSILGVNSTLIFSWNKSKTGYEYAVVLDPQKGSPGLYFECIILGNSDTMDNLAYNQILTDRGIYYLDDIGYNFEIGNTYGLAIEEETVIMVYNSLKSLEKKTIVKNINQNITYLTGMGEREMKLPEKTVYYYKGNKIAYTNLGNALSVNSTVVFALNKSMNGYEYAVILDPLYSAPQIAIDYDPYKASLGTISMLNCQIIRNGELIKPSDIEEKDVVYNVWDASKTNRYVMVINDKVDGKLGGILPNYISPETILVDGKSYEFSPDMKFSKITTASLGFKKDDDVTILLGRDKKVVDIYNQEYIGQETQIIITGNSKTTDTLLKNQVLTDKGVFYVKDGLALTLGNKYEAIIDKDKIIKVEEELKVLTSLTISDVIDNKITYNYPATLSMVMPRMTDYYYNGLKVANYDNLKNILKVNTSIIFAYSDEETGYEYAIILDPVYSKPEVATNYQAWLMRVGDISLRDVRLIKNGEIIKPHDIDEMDVVYEVSDFLSTSKYVLVVDNRVEGEIVGILPSKLSPAQLNVSGKIYDFSPDMKFEKIKHTTTSFKNEDNIIALLGHDGRVVDMLYEVEDETSDLAVVLNYEKTISTDLEDYGSTIYYVKLLLTNGQVVVWKADEEPNSIKGTLVRFKKEDLDPDPDVEDIKVSLSQINILAKWQEYVIDRDEGKVGDNFVTDNVTIFNRIHSTGSGDALVDILNWGQMPNDVVKAGKIQYINSVGEFGDINLLMIDDLYDEKYKYGVVTDIESSPMVCTVSMIIDGIPYKYVSTELIAGEIGKVVRVEVIDNSIRRIMEWMNPEKQSIKIDAVDKKRVKIDGIVYPFADNITIYFKDATGKVSTKGINDIDKTKTYGKVSVYLDRPLNEKGKVKALVIYE